MNSPNLLFTHLICINTFNSIIWNILLKSDFYILKIIFSMYICIYPMNFNSAANYCFLILCVYMQAIFSMITVSQNIYLKANVNNKWKHLKVHFCNCHTKWSNHNPHPGLFPHALLSIKGPESRETVFPSSKAVSCLKRPVSSIIIAPFSS